MLFLMPSSRWLKSLGFPLGHKDLEEGVRSNRARSVVRLLAQQRAGRQHPAAEVAHPGHRTGWLLSPELWDDELPQRWTQGVLPVLGVCVRWEGRQGAVSVDCNSHVKHNKLF